VELGRGEPGDGVRWQGVVGIGRGGEGYEEERDHVSRVPRRCGGVE
jgi:hypothetical protein